MPQNYFSHFSPHFYASLPRIASPSEDTSNGEKNDAPSDDLYHAEYTATTSKGGLHKLIPLLSPGRS